MKLLRKNTQNVNIVSFNNNVWPNLLSNTSSVYVYTSFISFHAVMGLIEIY